MSVIIFTICGQQPTFDDTDADPWVWYGLKRDAVTATRGDIYQTSG